MALINYLTQIQFAEGAVGLLAQELAALGIERPLVAVSYTHLTLPTIYSV